MHPVFAAAAIARPPRVLVFQLLPMQLGHALLLEAIGSPYMVGGPVEKPDLALAAWICSRAATVAMAGVKAGKPSPLLMRAVARACRKADWTAADGAFVAHLETHMRHPRRWGASGSAPRAPWQWLAAARLTGGDASKLGAAWDTPLLDVTCYLTAGDVIAGDDTIISEDEELAAEKLKATT